MSVPRRRRVWLAAIALAAAGCDGGLAPEDISSIDGGGGDPGKGDELGERGLVGRSADMSTVVVWSQNIRMGLEAWPNIVRCMGDPACNGMGALPDVILLQEASCADARDLQALLAAPRSEGGLGVRGWKRFCADNPRSGGVTGHWMSNAIIYRSDRFVIERAANARRVEFYSGDGTYCAKEGKVLPVVKLLDIPRRDAGKLERRVTVAVRHDDHFGNGNKNTCPAADAPTVFCAWKNSKLIDSTIDELGGGLLVMAGDWNFAARYCVYDGVATNNFKYAYGCTTGGLRESCAPANLGWRDPLLEDDPTVYDQRKVIDFLHARDVHDMWLNRTERNHRPGVVGTHFYCEGHGPYSGGGATEHPQRMSDHGARLVRLHY